MIPMLIEAALRALLMALAVGAGLRLFRVSNVPAQKMAWGLVLACAVGMPLAMRWQVLPASMALRVPATLWQRPADSSPNQKLAPLPDSAGRLPVAAQSEFSGRYEPGADAGGRISTPTVSKAEFNLAAQTRQSKAPPAWTLPASSQYKATAFFSGIGAWRAGLHLADLGTLAGFLYFAVSAMLLARMVYGLATAARLWLRSEPFEPEPGPNPESDPGRGLRIRFSFAIFSPVTIGSGVLLPADCLHWDREKLRIVLAHERAHVRQGDFYLQLLAGVYSAVFWFSPLGWWLKRKLCDLSEAMSDFAGLEEAASRASYAQVLLEFAALPRPTAIGVAMARKTNLSQRIERLLNESSFRQAFAGSRRRLLLAVLLVPAALFAGTALIRVEASAQAVQPAPPAAPNPAPAPAAVPDQTEAGEPVDAELPPAPAAPAAPRPPTGPAPAVAPQAGPAPPAAPATPAAPAAPNPPPLPEDVEIHASGDGRFATVINTQNDTRTTTNTITADGKGTSMRRGYSYSYSSDGGDTVALVSGNGNISGMGHFGKHFDEIRSQVHGDFIYYEHGGKAYVIDDPALVTRAKEFYRPIEELGRLQETLGKKQEELGRKEEELEKRQEKASVPTPDISKEMVRLNEAVSKLDAKKGSTVGQEELAEVETRLAEIQERLGELHGEMGARMGELGERLGEFGEQQGKLGEEHRRLGEEQGKLAEEANRKVKSIIDESLRNGKAREVK